MISGSTTCSWRSRPDRVGLRAFYGGVLGMTEIPSRRRWRAAAGAVPVGYSQLHLGVEADFRRPKAHPGLLVEDLDAIVARLADAGRDVRPDDVLPG